MKNKLLTRPAYLEVNLDDLVHNIRVIKRNININSSIIAVVKANAYGFGVKKIVETLIEEGIDYFAVATLQEAMEIRKYHRYVKIMVLGYSHMDIVEKAIKNNIELSVYRKTDAIEIDKVALKLGMKAKSNIVLDTGMNRIGFKEDEDFVENITSLKELKNVEFVGCFSHFAVSDIDPSYTRFQFDNFIRMNNVIRGLGLEIPIRHISNSSAILNYREYNLEAVRPGIIMYGSTEGIKKCGFDVRYIGSLRAKIANIKTINEGEKVSYGLIYTAKRKTKLATLPIGYADGILRTLSEKIDVIIEGKRCPVVGRICMDQMMVDVTDVNLSEDSIATVIGKDGNEEITIEEVAQKAGEIATSYSTHFSPRLPRVYIKNGKIDEIYDEISLL